MTTHQQLISSLIIVILSALSHSLWAQSEPSSNWSAGVIGIWETEPYKDMDDELLAFPVVTYRSQDFYWLGPMAGIRVGVWNDFTAYATAQIRLDSYDADDSPFLKDMESRDATLELGMEVKYASPIVNFSLAVSQDVLDKHEGQAVNFKLSKDFFFQQRFKIEPYIGVSWLSNRLADYYYGVRRQEARPDRPQYELSAALNYEYGIETFYSLTRRTSLLFSVSGEQLDSDIEDSPIIEDGNTYGVFIGFLYQF